MSDDTPTPETDTPALSAPDEGHAPAESQIDYEKRYNDLRSEFDRRNQQLSEVETKLSRLSDPEARAEVLAEYGLELEVEQPEVPVYDDPYDELRSEIAELKSARQQEIEAAQAEAQQAQTADYILSEIAKIEAEVGRELTEREVKFVSLAAQADPDERGVPNVPAAWKELDAEYTERQKGWIKGKPRHVAPAGQSASKQPDLSTRAGRLEHALDRYNAQQE